MKAWWQARNRRERGIVLIGGVLALAIIAWALVWEPLRDSRDGLRREVQRQSAELAWMRPAVAEALARGGLAEPVHDGRSLLARIDAGAREAGLGNQLVAVEPQGEGRVGVRFAAVDFDRFANWLEELGRSGLAIDALSVQRAAAGGVDVRLDLREGAR